MVEEALLSSLCGICNTAKSKYQCPACSARTCSLPCYKRHQTRALCSGKRDPTKYVKRSQLATPAGIDHDFNFITAIERELDRAERHVTHRGLGAAPEPHLRYRQPKGQLSDHDFAAAAVSVVRAPKGLSRQRENKSHRSSKGKHIVWTVEWIREDKTRLLTECTSALSIDESQPFPVASKKRKKPAADPLPTKREDADHASTLPPVKVRRLDEAGTEGAEHPSPRRQSPGPERVRDGPSNPPGGPRPHSPVASIPRPGLDIDGPDAESLPSEYRFFLLKPQTSSSRHVLVPLSPSATLGQCLRGRTVLEFPTIYAFPGPAAQLPEAFMLEEDYLKHEGEEQKEFEDMLQHAHPDILHALCDGNGDERAERGAEDLDSRKILDVLKQDLGNYM